MKVVWEFYSFISLIPREGAIRTTHPRGQKFWGTQNSSGLKRSLVCRLEIELLAGDVDGDLCSSSLAGVVVAISFVSFVSFVFCTWWSFGWSFTGACSSIMFSELSSLIVIIVVSAVFAISEVVESRYTTSTFLIGGWIGKSSVELISRPVLSWLGWLHIFSTSLSHFGVDFMMPWGSFRDGGEYELEVCCWLVGSFDSIIKSCGSDDVMISKCFVPGDSDWMLWILTVGENLSLFLLTDMKLLFSDELEYSSFRSGFDFASRDCCRAAAFDFNSNVEASDGFVNLVFAFFSHWGLWGFQGDLFLGACWRCCFWGGFDVAFFVARWRFWACWFLLAMATMSACPIGLVSIALRLGPGWFCCVAVCCNGAFRCCFAMSSCCLARAVFSSKQNFLIFSWLRLYSPTVLHATICISLGLGSGSGSRGFVSVTMAKSFLLITVFFRLSVSNVIVWGE